LAIIKGGRYRVEAIVSVAPDDGSGENVYRVRDLQGYERCWSCGAVHGPENATNTYCSQCGAELLAGDYLMYERHISAEGMRELGVGVTNGIGGANEAHDSGVPAAGSVNPDERIFVEGQRAYRIVPNQPESSPFPRGVRLLVGAGADAGRSRASEQNEDSVG